MKHCLTALFSITLFFSHSQVIGGRNNSEQTPQVSKPAELSSGVYSGDVNLFTGDYNSTIKLGSVHTPSGLSYALSLNYSSSFSMGNTMPVSTGIPYGEGWNLNIPTISIETEVFNNFTLDQYCTESLPSGSHLDFGSVGNKIFNEGDVYWFAPYINIPGVASGRAVFKYIDANDGDAAVFELNQFETHVEIRYNKDTWVVIVSDGTRYTFRTAIQSYNAPANKRVLYYDQLYPASGANEAEDVQLSGEYTNPGQAATVENSILPKQKYNLWYCNSITHRNQPFQGIHFTYKGFGLFNYFKEFDQEAYKYAAVEHFLSSTFAKDHDFSCYSDLLLMKVEAISIDGLVDRLELNYDTDHDLIVNNNIELIDYEDEGKGRLDELYSYESIYDAGKGEDFVLTDWKRYEHTKANSTTNPYAVSSSNPYQMVSNQDYVRTDAGGSGEIPFSHSFLESPRLMTTKIYPGDIYELKSKITRSGSGASVVNSGTFDMRIVTGDLENPQGLNSNSYSTYNSNYTPLYFSNAKYNSSRGKVLYSTFNMALKWSLNYPEGIKELSNLFVMPNIPTKYGGFNFQIGPGNSDINYAVPREDVFNASTHKCETGNAYVFTYGQPTSLGLKSAADIPGNFGVGLPWNLVAPIFERMIIYQNTLSYSSAIAKDVYNFWWNNITDVDPSHAYTNNIPTKLDNTVKLDEFELIRYTKNPYMLVGVKYYKVNGDVGGPVEEGLHLISEKKFEYTSVRCRMLENYEYEDGDPLQYRNDVQQVFVLLKAVHEVPLEWTSDVSELLTTSFLYTKFTSTATTFDPAQPMNGHFGVVLTQIVDNLGGITKIEYYPVTDSRTRYTGSFLRKSQSFCGVQTDPGYGLSRTDVVHPIVKYVLRNDEDDLLHTGISSSDSGHKRWFYDFDNSSRANKSSVIQLPDDKFYNGRRFNFDVGFSKVSVYGPTLMEGSSEFVNRTDYEHYGGDFDYILTFPTLEEYLYHGKLKSVKEYDVNNKLFTEKLITYEYTLAYQNGHERPNAYRENLVWEQEYDNPGLQYEYRDYYLNVPLEVGSATGPAAFDLLDISTFSGSGQAFELPKYLEFKFYSELSVLNPDYMLHSYFVRKKEEINRKYDDYLYKQAIVSGTTLPAPLLNTSPNPFGSGFTNPVVYNSSLATAQIGLIATATEAAMMDSLTDQSPLMDSVMYHVINTTRLSNANKLKLLLLQGNLSNLTLNRFLTKFGALRVSIYDSPVSVIKRQAYISDEVLLSTFPKLGSRWNAELLEALLNKNEYLSDQVVQAFANMTNYSDPVLFTKVLMEQPQFSEDAIDAIIGSSNLNPEDLSLILSNQVITDDNYATMIASSALSNEHIVEVIETGDKYPSEAVFGDLMTRSPAFSENEMERIIAAADRDLEPAVLSNLIIFYGNLHFLTGFHFTGNPLKAYCNNAVQSGWSYIETKTTYEYYEADYKGRTTGRAYKVLMGLEDIPGKVVSMTDIFGSGGNLTINNVRLKHEPSWQLFSVTTTSPHLPTAKDEKQYFYLYDLKNRYDRYWYNYDLEDTQESLTPFDRIFMNADLDTITFDTRWAPEYFDAYTSEAPVLPKFDGMIKSRQSGMRTTAFQQMNITKNQRDAKEIRKSEYYFYDARWVMDPYSVFQDAPYLGPICPETGTPPADPVGCASCVRWKYGTEDEFLAQLPFNYCLWKDPVIGYFVCPSGVNYAACFNGVELIDCNPSIPEDDEPGGPSQLPILTDVLKKTLQLRSTIIQVDTIMDIVSRDFSDLRFDRSNSQVADFYIEGSSAGGMINLDDQGFIRPFRMLFPYDTLTITKVHRRNQHMQPGLISNSVGLLTKFYYETTLNKWNHNTNCSNGNYNFLYNYSSVETRNIGLPIRITVGYNRYDSLGTDFEYTNDGQVRRMTSPSGHSMSYSFDNFNRLTDVTENGSRWLSHNEYSYWKRNSSDGFEDRTKENYVYSILYQENSDNLREFQKSFIDPLGRNVATVRAYKGEGDEQVSSGLILYDNWGRPEVQYKPIRSNQTVDLSNPLSHIQTTNLADPHNETNYENDPGSLDITRADPGQSISGWHTVNKQTWITNAIYMSCELNLNGSELALIMNSSTGNFRFLRTRIIDQDGKESITYTNAMGQLVATFASANMAQKVSTLYIYDSYGNLMKTINGERQHTNYQYNLMGQLIRETNVDGGEKRYIYNKHGKVSGIQDAFDRNNHETFSGTINQFRKFTYDIYGNLTGQFLLKNPYHIDPFCFENKQVGDPDNFVMVGIYPHYFDYVFSNRMTQDWLNVYKTIDPISEVDTIHSVGLPAVVSLSISLQEKFMVYGGQQSSPSTLGKLVESYSYSPYGDPIQKIVYTYNAEDLLESQAITQHPSNVATNDQFRVKATIYYPAYNYRGALLEEKLDMGSNGSIDMKYFYSYDSFNQLEKVHAAQSDVSDASSATLMCSYAYDDARGKVHRKSLRGEPYSAPVIIVNQYDDRDRLTEISTALFKENLYYDDQNIPSYYNANDDINHIVTQQDAYNGNIKGIKIDYDFSSASVPSIPLFSKETIYGYQYDRINRLVEADALVGDFIDAQFSNTMNLSPATSLMIGDESLGYDRIGNFIGQYRAKVGANIDTDVVEELFSYSYYNGTNRLEEVVDANSSANRTYTYDANGNIGLDSYKGVNARSYYRGSYPYKVTQGSDESIYFYDGADQRIYKKAVSSAQTTEEMYIKDAMGRDLSIVKFTDGGSVPDIEYFVYGNERVARVTVGSTTPLALIQPDEAMYFIYDHLGNTRVTLSINSSDIPTILNVVDYFSYGKILREYDNTLGDGNRYLTTQHERDKETELDYRGARYYDSDIGRFLSTDPWTAKYPEWSTYNYVMGNPISLIDPTGKGVTNWIKNIETQEVEWRSEVKSEETTPEGYEYLGRTYMGMTVLRYEKRTDGVNGIGVQIGYNDKKNEPIVVNFVQTVRTDDPPKGVDGTYNDPAIGAGKDDKPFYYTDKDLPAALNQKVQDIIFEDSPFRHKSEGDVNWSGELSLVKKGEGGRYDVIITLCYGFEVKNGTLTVSGIKVTEPTEFQTNTINQYNESLPK